MNDRIWGIPVIVSPLAVERVREQVRFPRSKKKRIRAKWRKDPRNWREREVPVAYLINTEALGRQYVIHPEVLAAIERAGVARLPASIGTVGLAELGADGPDFCGGWPDVVLDPPPPARESAMPPPARRPRWG